MPVGVETELVELDADKVIPSGEEEDYLREEKFAPLQAESPMLWFSGIIDPSHLLPSVPSTPSQEQPTSLTTSHAISTMPPLRPRLARLTLRTCVTSLDGSSQVVYSPPPVIVRNYQQAERFGEMCAEKIKARGGKEILDEVGGIRRERERQDLEKAIERSRREQSESQASEAHHGLKRLVDNLVGDQAHN